MKRLLTFLVILALIGYLSFKGAVWWLADQRLADAQQAIEELGVIDRGNIRSDLVGRLVLGDGSYQDFRLTRPVVFDRLMFNAGSPVALVRARRDHPQRSQRLQRHRLRLRPDGLRQDVHDG